MPDVRLLLGNCLERMAEIEDGSVDAIIADPPYPMIDRPYGKLTEAEWWDLMMGVCAHARRVLKPTGSAVFVLQPNSRKVGSMRGWLFEFQAWACREWNMVQDAYWWKHDALPTEGAPTKGLMRPSVKPCVWLGSSDCYRNQAAVLWAESDSNRAQRMSGRCDHTATPGKQRSNTTPIMQDKRRLSASSERRGGVTPFNVVMATNASHRSGHSASTPLSLCDWWVRYISPPDSLVCDPFCGSGTTGLAALKRGRRFIGIEKFPAYYEISRTRLQEEQRRLAEAEALIACGTADSNRSDCRAGSLPLVS